MFYVLDSLLDRLADEIDLTDSQQGAIKHAYNNVADWLNQNGTCISKYDVDIFPQGSMMYGTAVRPIKEDDYDVDVVCEFRKNYLKLSPFFVKQIVGKRLKENDYYAIMLQPEGKRCWTLQYSDELNFHMDILPAIPYDKSYLTDSRLNEAYKGITIYKELALLATHRDKASNYYQFIPTNPRGYAEWFRGRISPNNSQRVDDGVERLPDYPYKTTLQKTIQLLKRHRDVFFENKEDEYKPISMIITTLCALSYQGETSIAECLISVLKKMPSFIKKDNGVYVIENPVMKQENFADKWKESDRYAQMFFAWLAQARNDINVLIELSDIKEIEKTLKRLFAQKPVDRLMEYWRSGGERQTRTSEQAITKYATLPHRNKPPWALPRRYNVSVVGKYRKNEDSPYTVFKSGEPIVKGLSLLFEPIHQIKKPFSIRWQITNTGDEAASHNCLRGNFEDSNVEGAFGIMSKRKEESSFTGCHYVQCFIIKGGNQCVGYSAPFIVNIK